MQTTLLGLAVALILALISALVAPLVVDWNNYRPAFEREASRLAGLPVRVNGAIEARILPSPRIKMRDVDVGEAGGASQVRAAAVEVEFGLGGLVRGRLNATELRIIAPQVSVGLDRSGVIDWPALSLSFRSDALTISRLDIEDGRIVLADAASGLRLLLQKFWFNGEVRSFVGPVRGEGAFVVGDELYGYRISAGRLDDFGGMKLKLGIDPSNHPLTAELDGTFSFDKGIPQFDGTLALARPVGAALARGDRVLSDPWQFGGKIHATPALASLQDIAVQYGPDERAVNFTGKGELSFGARPHFEGSVAARQVDVDRMLAAPDLTHRPPLVMMKNFVTAFVAAVKPPLPSTLSVAVDALTVGGTTLQSLHGGVRFDGNGWSLSDVAFRAPGLSEIGLSGRIDSGPQGLAFSGPAKLETVDLKTLMGWLEGRSEPTSGPGQAFVARGDIAIASDRFTLDRLSAALDRENVEGRLAYTWAAGDKPAAVDAELHSATLNVDALTNFVKKALSDSALEVPRQVALVLDVGKATFAGVDAQRVNAKVKFDAGILHIDKLSIGDLGGAALDLGGRIDELSSQPRGRLTLDLDARTLSGLINIAARVAPRTADALRPLADLLAPTKIHGVLTVDRAPAASGSAAKLDLGGDVGAMRLALNGQAVGDPALPAAAQIRVTGRLDADDGSALVQLFDLDRVVAVDQLPGQMTFSANGPLDGTVQVKGMASAGGFSTVVEGMLHLNAGGSSSGSLQVKASASDLRPLHQTMTGQVGAAAPVTLSAILGFAGSDLTITDLIVGAGKSSLHGRLDLKLASPVDISGDIAADNMDVAAVSAALLGLPGAAAGTGATWSREPIGAGAFAPLAGAVAFKVDRAALTPALTARDLKGVVKLQPSEIAFDDVEGSLAGGRLTAELTARHDPENIALRGRIELAGAGVAALLPSESAVDGTVTLKIQGEGLGASPDDLVASLHGGGSITLRNLQLAGIDPAAFDAALRIADPNSPIDEPKLRTAVNATMESGRLSLAQGDGNLTIAGGQIRLAPTTMSGPEGTELSVDGMLDLNAVSAGVHMRLSAQPTANALIPTRPELAINAKGPFPSLDRTVDLSKLMAWLTLRATELQTRRLELIEANRRLQAPSTALRPTSPAVRFITMGTAVETSDHADVSAGQTLSARSLDRLRPALPAAGSPAARGDAGTAAAAASPSSIEVKPATPQPAPHSPLDLLFHLQN